MLNRTVVSLAVTFFMYSWFLVAMSFSTGVFLEVFIALGLFAVMWFTIYLAVKMFRKPRIKVFWLDVSYILTAAGTILLFSILPITFMSIVLFIVVGLNILVYSIKCVFHFKRVGLSGIMEGEGGLLARN